MGQKHNTNGLATKLNWLKKKSRKYVSHKDFLSKCMKSNSSKNKNILRKSVQLSLEPTIENFDQELINGTPVWKGFLLHYLTISLYSVTKPLKKNTIKLIKRIAYSKQSLKKQNMEKSEKLLHQMKPEKKNSTSTQVQKIQQQP